MSTSNSNLTSDLLNNNDCILAKIMGNNSKLGELRSAEVDGEIVVSVYDFINLVYDFINLVTDHDLGDTYGYNTLNYMKKVENEVSNNSKTSNKFSKTSNMDKENFTSPNIDEDSNQGTFNYKKYQFPGRGQRLTPVFNTYQAQHLLTRLDGKIADRFRKVATMNYSRVMAGDFTLIDSIIENNKRNDDVANMHLKIVNDNIDDQHMFENYYQNEQLNNNGNHYCIKNEDELLDYLSSYQIL